MSWLTYSLTEGQQVDGVVPCRNRHSGIIIKKPEDTIHPHLGICIEVP